MVAQSAHACCDRRAHREGGECCRRRKPKNAALSLDSARDRSKAARFRARIARKRTIRRRFRTGRVRFRTIAAKIKKTQSSCEFVRRASKIVRKSCICVPAAFIFAAIKCVRVSYRANARRFALHRLKRPAPRPARLATVRMQGAWKPVVLAFLLPSG